MNYHCAFAAQNLPMCWAASKDAWAAVQVQDILPLCPMLLRLYLQCCIQLRDTQKDTDMSEWIQKWTENIIRVLEHLSYEDKLRELGLLSLEERKLERHHIVSFQYGKRAYKKDREKLFAKACSERT